MNLTSEAIKPRGLPFSSAPPFTSRWRLLDTGPAGNQSRSVSSALVTRGFGSASSAQNLLTFVDMESPAEVPHALFLDDAQGQSIAHLTLWPKTLCADGRTVLAGDIGSVVVAPEYRGQGLAYRLFAEAEKHARLLKLDVLLLGGQPAIYRKFGFQNNGATMEFLFPAEILRGLPCEKNCVALGPPSVQHWKHLHGDALDGNHRIRNDAYLWNWHRFLSHPPSPWFCLHLPEGEGILVAQWRRQKIWLREFLARDEKQAEWLLAAVARQYPEATFATATAARHSSMDRIFRKLRQRLRIKRQNSHGTMWKIMRSELHMTNQWYISLLDRR